MKCPKCNTECEPYAEVDIGIGVMQGGPWGCPACHWVEPDEDFGLLPADETFTDTFGCTPVAGDPVPRCRNMAHKRYNLTNCSECDRAGVK